MDDEIILLVKKLVGLKFINMQFADISKKIKRDREKKKIMNKEGVPNF